MSEEMIVRHCSPTLAGLKTGSLFRCPCKCPRQLREDIRRLNRRLAHKGIHFLPLKFDDKGALIYVYRPKKLGEDLKNALAESLLEMQGYVWQKPAQCIAKLAKRLSESGDFPHEIGLFLGYPPEDVHGFIHQGPHCCKCTGCWKVYGNEEEAQRTFARYNKCTPEYLRQLTTGNTIERLTVKV